MQTTKRTGWLRKGIRGPESIADHMYRMSMMAMLAPAHLDRDRCIRLAIVHDLAEGEAHWLAVWLTGPMEWSSCCQLVAAV